MRAKEFVVERSLFQKKPQLNQAFVDAFYAWRNMRSLESMEQAAVTILKDPISAPYRVPPAGLTAVYRTVGDINKTAVAKNRVAVAYATKPIGAETFGKYAGLRGREYHIVQKKFIPQEFLLDYGRMAQDLGLENKTYKKEHEVWMRPVPYYASYNADELLDRRAWYQKLMGQTPHPAAKAKADAAEIARQEEKLRRQLELLFPNAA